MNYDITKIRIGSGSRHEHITDYFANGNWYTKSTLTNWLRNHTADTASVTDPLTGKTAYAIVRDDVPGTYPFLQTVSDGYYRDNLLSLPRE